MSNTLEVKQGVVGSVMLFRSAQAICCFKLETSFVFDADVEEDHRSYTQQSRLKLTQEAQGISPLHLFFL